MQRLSRMLMIAPALCLGLMLAGCSSFDPSDIADWFTAAKKPLPGDRKELFPGGTPGVSQGLPPDLVKGYQPPPPDAQPAPDPDQPKAKKKPRVAAAPPPASAAPDPSATGTATR